MICIRDKFSQNIGRQVPSKVIWDHLSTMYDMQALVSQVPSPPDPAPPQCLPGPVFRGLFVLCTSQGAAGIKQGAPSSFTKNPNLVTVAGSPHRTSFTWGGQ